MKVEITAGGSAEADVAAKIDDSLPPGEVVRDGREVRVGLLVGWGADGVRAAAAAVARTLRRKGGSVAWRAGSADDARAIVEGTAFGAYDPGIRKRGYGDTPELTLV